jgi:hypothetical protein
MRKGRTEMGDLIPFLVQKHNSVGARLCPRFGHYRGQSRAPTGQKIRGVLIEKWNNLPSERPVEQESLCGSAQKIGQELRIMRNVIPAYYPERPYNR